MDVIYSVTAMIDLLGFSSHLEIGGYDFRTNIGKEALNRLNILVEAIKLFENERKNIPEVYPETFFYRRINDAIILTIDLPEMLTPPIGYTIKRGMSFNDFDKYFSEDEDESKTEEELLTSFYNKHFNAINNLLKFVGLVGRLHQYINNQENKLYYPGAKTVVSTGFRLPFITDEGEDYLSANFSFSNTFIAEKHLKGPKLFIDTNVIEIISFYKYGRNIFQLACVGKNNSEFNPFSNDDSGITSSLIKELDKFKINILRKDYEFREVNASPLVYLQLLYRIKDYLDDKKIPQTKSQVFKKIIDLIKNGIDIKEVLNKPYKGFWIHSLNNGIEEDIRIIIELIEEGQSKTAEEINNRKMYIISGI